MSKTVVLKLVSTLCEEEVEIPEKLWKKFEEKAKEFKTPPEELLIIALDTFLKERGY